MSVFRIYKDWIITQVTLWLKGKPFHIKTPIDYIILSLRTAGYLPEKIYALELFGMYGLYVTKHYAHLCEYVDLWELEPAFAKFARKFSDKNVRVIEGDSVTAVRKQEIKGRYNFFMIDNPLVSPYGPELFEHFNVMPDVFNLALNDFVIVFNVILTTPELLYRDYGFNTQEQTEQRAAWERRREEFYGTKNQNLKPQDYIELYTAKFSDWRLKVNYATFLPRNERVGFLCFALKRYV